MKIKYYRLTKEERRNYREKFYTTDKGKNLKKYTNYSYLMCILLFILAIYYSIDAYINHLSKWYYIYSAIITLVSIVMIISIHKLRINKINDYIVKK